MKNREMKNWASFILSALLMIVTFAGSKYYSAPWCDELSFLDSAVNLFRTGAWHSEVFYLVNNPGFPFVAALATALFGASHLVVVAVGCLFAFFSSILIIKGLRRRNLLTSVTQEIFLVFLFWGGATFSKIILNGRPDTMTLFLAVWLLDGMFPAARRVIKISSVFLRAFLLMLVSAYTLPFLVFISALDTLCLRQRKDALLRTIAIAAGGGTAWLTIATFYAYHHELFRFLGYYAAFNSITGEKFGSFVPNVVAGYGFDPMALLLLGILLCVIFVRRIWKTQKRLVAATIVASLIPFLMISFGRYAPYYSWMFYISTGTCLAIAYVTLKRRIRYTLLAFSVVLWLTHFFLMDIQSAEQRQKMSRAEEFVKNNRNRLLQGHTVVVADDTVGDVSLYYPLRALDIALWFRGPIFLRELSDEQKFDLGLSLFIKDPSQRKEILGSFLKYQNVMPLLPDSDSLVIFVSPTNQEIMKPILEKAGRQLTYVASDGERALYQMSPKCK